MDKKPITCTIGIPLDCGHRHEFWISLIRLIQESGNFLSKGSALNCIYNPGDSLICRSRNNIVHEFLMNPKLGCLDNLLMIDSDICFDPESIFRLLSHRIEGIICGQYFLKQPMPQPVLNGIKGEKPDKNGLLKVADAGTGCMLIHRNVFKKMQEKMGESHYYRCDMNKDRRFSFFNAGAVNGRYLSEDYLFCHRARAMGIPVYLDTKVTVQHLGWASYPLDIEALAVENKKRKNELRRSAAKR